MVIFSITILVFWFACIYALLVRHIHFCVTNNCFFIVDISYLRRKDVDWIVNTLKTTPVEYFQITDHIHLRHSLCWCDINSMYNTPMDEITRDKIVKSIEYNLKLIDLSNW